MGKLANTPAASTLALQGSALFAVLLCMALTGTRVLLVEDDTVLARICSRGLTAAGYVVDVASDGAEGFARVLAAPYDVVVSDVCMPRMDGLDLLQQVRRMRPRVQVVLMTARLDEQTYVHAREMGAVRYLLKPMTMEQLARAVQMAALLKAAALRSSGKRVA